MILRTGILLFVLSATGCEKKAASEELPSQAAKEASKVDPSNAKKNAFVGGDASRLEKVEVPEVRVRADGPTTVLVSWLTPAGTTVNDDAPFRVRWNRSDGLVDAPSDVKSTGSAVKNGFRVSVRPMAGAPNPTLVGEIQLVVCDAATHAVCVPVKREIELGFVAAKDATSEATVAVPLPAAK